VTGGAIRLEEAFAFARARQIDAGERVRRRRQIVDERIQRLVECERSPCADRRLADAPDARVRDEAP